MSCKNCSYYYLGESDDFPICHFTAITSWDKAPCEYEEEATVSYEEINDLI